MATYSIGQVLFLVSKQDQKVIPMQIIEEVRRKNLDGETIDYLVKLPSTGDKKINLKKIDAHVYEDLDMLKAALLEKAQDLIENISHKAGELATNKFNWNQKARVAQIHDLSEKKSPPGHNDDGTEGSIISLDDGTRVHLPPEISNIAD